VLKSPWASSQTTAVLCAPRPAVTPREALQSPLRISGSRPAAYHRGQGDVRLYHGGELVEAAVVARDTRERDVVTGVGEDLLEAGVEEQARRSARAHVLHPQVVGHLDEAQSHVVTPLSAAAFP
jgi:hypothetical protein